jgi:hypothetical protein
MWLSVHWSGFWLELDLLNSFNSLWLHTVTERLVFSVTFFITWLGNFFLWWMFLCSWAHSLSGLQPSHTNLLLVWHLKMAAGNHCIAWPDCTENTTFKGSSVVAWLLNNVCVTWWVNRPWASNFCRDSPSPWVRVLRFQQHPTDRCHSP